MHILLLKNLYQGNLEQALNHLERSKAAQEYFGEEFIKLFLAIGRNEIALYEQSVTDWGI